MPFCKRPQKESRRLKSSSGEVPVRFDSCVRCYLEPFLSLACDASLNLAIRQSVSIAIQKSERLSPSIIRCQSISEAARLEHQPLFALSQNDQRPRLSPSLHRTLH